MNASVLLRTATERVSRIPWMFDCLRYALEGGFRTQRALIARHLAHVRGRVLDCGCGTGALASALAPGQYLGIDLSADYIARARHCHPGYDFEPMDARRLPLKTGSFEAVLMCGIIHHLDDEVAHRVLGEVWRVLKPGGILLACEDVATRSAGNIIGRMVQRLDVGEHIRTEEAYVRLLQSKFQVESVEPLLSGWMDYACMRCSPLATTDAAAPIGTGLFMADQTESPGHVLH